MWEHVNCIGSYGTTITISFVSKGNKGKRKNPKKYTHGLAHQEGRIKAWLCCRVKDHHG